MKNNYKLTIVVSLTTIFGFAVTAKAQEWFEGRWATEKRFCKSDGEDSPISIDEARADFYEYGCDRVSTRRTTSREWTLKLSCKYDEPESHERTLILRRTDGGRLSLIWDNQATQNNLVRCSN